MTKGDLKKQRRIFLNDTIKYYRKDPINRRATVAYNNCKYRIFSHFKRTKKCAIGRWIPNEKYKPCIEGYQVTCINVMNLLPLNISYLGGLFLTEVQQLHDIDEYWTSDGLSIDGNKKASEIRKKYIN